MIKSMLVLMTFVLLPSAANAQQVSYSYDAAGNRVSRSSAANAPQLFSRRSVSRNSSSQLQQAIYVGPNPTNGPLSIRFSQWDDTNDCSLVLSNMSGQVFIRQAMTSTEAMLNLSTFPKGYYLLEVELNGDKSTYKIIKN